MIDFLDNFAEKLNEIRPVKKIMRKMVPPDCAHLLTIEDIVLDEQTDNFIVNPDCFTGSRNLNDAKVMYQRSTTENAKSPWRPIFKHFTDLFNKSD